ncbi:hypothetical protein [Fusobacterium sp.]|uniref:hypothetical protein n=2 Tax=Fusobacteriaceae TaxID=203492 RepID=UPI0001AFF297|nr:hypothetical protein [Fusobacterium sp.]EES63302.1 hypothetical protein FVAG_00991 [Fusobacterium varium ATCC 27725]VEH39191.1 Uncharacterised protein [Fusobacterium varium]HBJ79696.1 hypothetical protein [Fusobacterium sp.]
MGDDEKMSNGEIEKLEKMIDELKEELHECDYEPERNALLKKYKRLTVQMEELKKLKRKKND